MKGLRKILGLEPTFIDRNPENTNEAVLEKVNNILSESGTRTNVLKARKLSEVVEMRRKTLLGHVIRAPDDDPMKKATFDNENQNLKPLDMGHCREGRPREKWLEATMRSSWNDIRRTQIEYSGNAAQRGKIKKAARDRIGPFRTKPR